MPDQAWLREHKDLWIQRADLRGINWDLDDQLDWLRETCAPYYREVRGLDFFRNATSSGWGLGFGPIESQVLHCVIRTLAPARILEIGSGVSTACIVNAVRTNVEEKKRESSITCIEPHPSSQFNSLPHIHHIRDFAQAVPREVFADLNDGDLLFIDSSHAVKTGSDVIRIYLDIIPHLPPGVIIHVHDIYLPYLYPRDVFTSFYSWQETVLLTALLTNNSHLSVLACLSALHYDRSAEIQTLLSDYLPEANEEGLYLTVDKLSRHFPSSLWLRTS
jgi:predicted O-methyltransferase YrrM